MKLYPFERERNNWATEEQNVEDKSSHIRICGSVHSGGESKCKISEPEAIKKIEMSRREML